MGSSGKDILFLADTLVDVDLGLFKLMQKDYRNPVFVNIDMLDSDEIYFQQHLIFDCLNKEDVLSIILNNKAKPESISIYKSIIDERYDDIIGLSPITALSDLIIAHHQSEAATNIIPHILCKTKSEENVMKKLYPNIQTILQPDYTQVNLELYTRIVIRNIRDLEKFSIGRIKGKSILVMSYRYNFEPENDILLLKEYTLAMGDINNFEICLPYINYEPPMG